MILSGTGHRPDKLGGYDRRTAMRLRDLACRHLSERPQLPEFVISGMALGWDTALAYAALDLIVPLIAAVPFEGQERMWPEESQKHYRWLLKHADQVVHVSAPGYANWKMQRRNEWMVDHSHEVLALWNGTSGGTANCIRYAETTGKRITNLWQEFSK